MKNAFCQQAHVELSRSQAAELYVWKEDTRVPDSQFEMGERPLRRNVKRDWDDIWAKAKSGSLEDIDKGVVVQHYSNLKRIRVDYERPEWRRGVVVHVYWGVSGSGKSYRAFSEAEARGPYYIKSPHTKWWDGYKGEENVVIDEFSGQVQITYLLAWLQEYPCVAEVKGSQLCLKATNFWITSNIDPNLWYFNDNRVNEEQKAALNRRLTNVVYFNELYVP